MMMMRRVMCVLAVVLCCACGCAMAAAAVASGSSSDGEVAHEDLDSSWNAGVKYDELVKAAGDVSWGQLGTGMSEEGKKIEKYYKCKNATDHKVPDINCSIWKEFRTEATSKPGSSVVPEQQAPQQMRQETGEQGADLTAGGIQANGVVGDVGREGANRRTEVSAESTPEGAVHSSTIDQQNNKGPLSDPAQDNGRNTGSLPDGSEAAGRTSSSQGATINDSSSIENQVTEGNTSTTVNATLVVSTDSPDSTNQSQVSDTTATNSISGADSHETNSTTAPSTENTTTEAPTTTPSPVPNAEINNIASTVQNKANVVDSSISPVWMGTAAPLLIVVVLVSVAVY
ncbi:uncharacterized protein TM35_000681200 [Trypanosoma theileri]|uniref:Mucin-associated surface protein (MASP) n=1 Tax=Trypanosoma theileri TaxID=67003 RepID=A0A1X0NG41_9TRYP|nr:uncharacterized protein TM35_000681200 [Trypanosoma theileri]ORC83488.1 hypothetical protein TM35_000681200 [Trypanosoma theileri]